MSKFHRHYQDHIGRCAVYITLLSRFSYHHRKHSSGGSGAEQLVRSRTTDSLQKTMPGGIFLIELSFQEVYFVVKIYVFSASQIGQSRQPHYKSNLKVHLP